MPSKYSVPGVYALVFPSGKFYVGSTAYLNRRKGEHFYALRRGKNPCSGVQGEFNASGELPSFEVLMKSRDKAEATQVEQWLLDGLHADGMCLNSASNSILTRLGANVTQETRQKLKTSRKCHRVVVNFTEYPSVKGAIREAKMDRRTIVRKIAAQAPGFYYKTNA